MPDTHILRFKVVSVECSSMADGQMYTINYRRGDTNRSTPCYSAQGGVVDFSSMPEGAAILHFKSGRQVGRRYAPKLVEFRVDEYTKGSPRRTVGEVDVDCSLVMGNNDTGRGIETQSFRMYGVMATIKVAFLVYREHSLPPVFGDLIPAVPANEAAPVAAIKGSIKKMSREEAMTLLISLETMLERQKVMRESGTSQPTNPMEARLQELEQKRKQLTASQGLATTVVTARCRDIVAAQFLATARRHRNNFVGETAAYLRQMALTSGIPTATIEAMIGGGAAPGAGGGAGAGAADQLARVTTRKVELRAQLSKLEEEQRVLGRLQERTDVTEQLISNLNKVSTLESQLKILEESEASIRASNEKQQQAQQVHTNTPLGREAKQINERIQELNQERKQLEPKIQHMTTVASGHVLAWARAKNPPEPDTTATATTEGGVAKAKPGHTTVDDLFGDAAPPPMLDEDQRKQILDAFHNMKATAPSAHQDALPTSSDFGADAPSRAAPKQSGGFRDPLRPEGLSRNMFSADASPPSEEASATNFFKMRETFQFGAAPSALQVAGRGEDEHFVTSAVREVPQQQQPAPTHEAPAVDPYYDEMDDFTPQAATTTAAATMDVGGAGGGLFGFNFGGGESSGAGAGGAVPRPVYNFGTDGNEAEEDHHAPARPAGLGTYDFGSGAPTGGYGQSRLPEYNFN